MYVTGNYVGRMVWRVPVADATRGLGHCVPVQASSFAAPSVTPFVSTPASVDVSRVSASLRVEESPHRSVGHRRWLEAGAFVVLLGLATFGARPVVADEAAPVFCLPNRSGEHTLAERLLASGLLPADADAQLDRVGACPGIGLRFPDFSPLAAFARRLDAAQPGYALSPAGGADAGRELVVIAEAQVVACAERVRQHVAASSGQPATLSFAGILTDRQRSALARHGTLGPKGTLNAALARMTSAERRDPTVVADAIATQLRQGAGVVFWDGDADLDTGADRWLLAPEAWRALRTEIWQALAAAEPVSVLRYPAAAEASSFVRRGLATGRVRVHGAAVAPTPARSRATAPGPRHWPWIVLSAVGLMLLGLVLRVRRRRPVAASAETQLLPAAVLVTPGKPAPPPVTEPAMAQGAARDTITRAGSASEHSEREGGVSGQTGSSGARQTGNASITLPVEGATRAPVIDPLIGSTIGGKYRIVQRVGRGGMARVYEAEQLSTGRSVAVKVLEGEVTPTSDEAKRFQREVRSAAKLRHPNTVQMIDFGHDAEHNLLYLAMELLEGKSLQIVLRGGPLPVDRALRIAIQILKSLAEAHARGIIHRDLKPGNIMLTTVHGEPDDFVKVIDFGIAKVFENGAVLDQLTKVGMVMGTPEYMSPEQAVSKPVDARSDLYSVGVILYQMLAGHRPFAEDTPAGYLVAHAATPPQPLVIPSGGPEYAPLITLVHRALAKDPAERPQTAGEFLSELTKILTQLSSRSAE